MAATTVAAIGLLLVSCAPPEEEEAPATGPKKVDFAGKVDPALVGSWKADSGASLDLKEDGKATIVSTSSSPGGPVKTTAEGNWLVADGSLLLKYTVSGQPETVIKYKFGLAGKELTLTNSIGTKTVYKK